MMPLHIGADTPMVRVLGTTLWWGLVAGVIAFGLGYFGPLVLAPGANQGPLLALFTGPLGFVIGAAAGFFRSARPRRQNGAPR